jgi:hypothetical protein
MLILSKRRRWIRILLAGCLLSLLLFILISITLQTERYAEARRIDHLLAIPQSLQQFKSES